MCTAAVHTVAGWVAGCVWLRLQATRARALLRDVARALAARTAARAADDGVDGADREELREHRGGTRGHAQLP